jgi:hypothetical protein
MYSAMYTGDSSIGVVVLAKDCSKELALYNLFLITCVQLQPEGDPSFATRIYLHYPTIRSTVCSISSVSSAFDVQGCCSVHDNTCHHCNHNSLQHCIAADQ